MLENFDVVVARPFDSIYESIYLRDSMTWMFSFIFVYSKNVLLFGSSTSKVKRYNNRSVVYVVAMMNSNIHGSVGLIGKSVYEFS